MAVILMLLLVVMCDAQAQQVQPTGSAVAEKTTIKATLNTLKAIVRTEQFLLERIQEISKSIESTQSESGRLELSKQESQLRQELLATRKSFSEIAAENDISVLKGKSKGGFDLKNEVLFLLEPALKEIKRMTNDVRKKSELREKLGIYNERLPVADSAIANLNALLSATDDNQLRVALGERMRQWRHQQTLLETDRQSILLQLDKLEAKEVSFTQATQTYLKNFFQHRGLYLLIAMLVVAAVITLSRLSANAMRRLLPGFRAKHRNFRIRLLQLLHQAISFILVIVGPMIVFYVAQDWVLFSLGILVLLAAAWTLRSAIPRYWHQIQLFLNVGSVREGERIEIDGLPWLVSQISFYSHLKNPFADLSIRLPIESLVGKNSRPVKANEPWFPCKAGDWVILSDGKRGKVVGISKELVQMVERGGAMCTYLMTDFLSLAPYNISNSFRLREVIGISYNLQKQSIHDIPEALRDTIRKRIEQEGYADSVLSLRVELGAAGSSSLDITVIIDFSGDVCELYGRLRRAIQRWCVEACTENDWEIPFPQLVLHRPVQVSAIG